MGVKVALAKTLKYLVVDTENSAITVKEFLEEKQIARDVLVLTNVPDKPLPKDINTKLKGFEGAHHLYNIIEVGRQNPLLDRAVRYFIGDKVIATTFD